MKKEAEQTVLFSGRFDRPHLGHIETITDLGMKFGKVLVIVLDHPEQMYPISYRVSKLEKMLEKCKGSYVVEDNSVHFGKITREEAELYQFDIYASGNFECLKHMEELDFGTLYVPRSDDYSATDDRIMQQIKGIFHVT